MKKVRELLLPIIYITVALFCGWKLWEIYQTYNVGQENYTELAEEFVQEVPAEKPSKPTVAPEKQPTEEVIEESKVEAPATISVNFEKLLARCDEVVAWIYSPNTELNYPIVQAEDNEKYLRTLMNGNYSLGGTLFMDYQNSSDFSDWNSIIYGHNMKDGSMFGGIPRYKYQSYYDEHPTMQLLTPTGDFMVEWIAGYSTTSGSDIYLIPQTLEERNQLLSAAILQSTFQSNVTVDDDDKLLTLSTCTYTEEDSRYVLIGVIRERAGDES